MGDKRKMTEEELEREYYGRRPTEPYSEDDSPNDWANIMQYAEENLGKAFKAIAELEKEKCELLGIIQGKDKVIQELEKENAEFRNIAEFQQSSNMNRYFENKKLKDENTGLKEKLNMRSYQNCKHNNKSCPNNGSCHNFSLWQPFINPELSKAKEIIKDYLTIAKGSHSTVCGVPEENRTIYVLKLNEEAEQFLNGEVEK